MIIGSKMFASTNSLQFILTVVFQVTRRKYHSSKYNVLSGWCHITSTKEIIESYMVTPGKSLKPISLTI